MIMNGSSLSGYKYTGKPYTDNYNIITNKQKNKY